MRRREAEILSRAIAHEPWESRWAMRRPPLHRVPLPAVGDIVLFRPDNWAAPIEATVEWVQPLDDPGDPMVTHWDVDASGMPILHEGRPVVDMHFDPWPSVRLAARDDRGLTVFRTTTREARLRGSAGWLAHDWESRWRPLPDVLIPHLDVGEHSEDLGPGWSSRFKKAPVPYPHQRQLTIDDIC